VCVYVCVCVCVSVCEMKELRVYAHDMTHDTAWASWLTCVCKLCVRACMCVEMILYMLTRQETPDIMASLRIYPQICVCMCVCVNVLCIDMFVWMCCVLTCLCECVVYWHVCVNVLCIDMFVWMCCVLTCLCECVVYWHDSMFSLWKSSACFVYWHDSLMLTCHHSPCAQAGAWGIVDLVCAHMPWLRMCSHDCVCAHMTWLFKSHLWHMLLWNSFTCVHKQYMCPTHTATHVATRCNAHCNITQRNATHFGWHDSFKERMTWLIQRENGMTYTESKIALSVATHCNTPWMAWLIQRKNGLTRSHRLAGTRGETIVGMAARLEGNGERMAGTERTPPCIQIVSVCHQTSLAGAADGKCTPSWGSRASCWQGPSYMKKWNMC